MQRYIDKKIAFLSVNLELLRRNSLLYKQNIKYNEKKLKFFEWAKTFTYMHNNLLVPRSYLNSNFWLIKFKSNVMHTLIETYDKLLNTLFERIHDKVSLRLLCMFSPLNVMLFVHANSIIVNRTENLKLLCIY